MALKQYNPVTPGQRQLVLVDRSALYSGKPVKALTEDGLFVGQSGQFFELLRDLASDADAARRDH